MKTFSYPLKNYCGVMQKITEKNNSAEQALRPRPSVYPVKFSALIWGDIGK